MLIDQACTLKKQLKDKKCDEHLEFNGILSTVFHRAQGRCPGWNDYRVSRLHFLLSGTKLRPVDDFTYIDTSVLIRNPSDLLYRPSNP